MIHATDVAARLGLKRYPRSWRGRCPCCDYAVRPSRYARRGDGRAKLYCANGCDRAELATAVARATGQPVAVPRVDADATASREHKRERALALWRGSEPAEGTLADRYLTGRGLPELATSSALRFRGDTPAPRRRPTARAGCAGAKRGRQADWACIAHSSPATGPRHALNPTRRRSARSGAVPSDCKRLAPGDLLVIGEGIETAASAGRLMGLPSWAAISAGNLAKGLVLPPEVLSVVIAADPDEAGQRCCA